MCLGPSTSPARRAEQEPRVWVPVPALPGPGQTRSLAALCLGFPAGGGGAGRGFGAAAPAQQAVHGNSAIVAPSQPSPPASPPGSPPWTRRGTERHHGDAAPTRARPFAGAGGRAERQSPGTSVRARRTRGRGRRAPPPGLPRAEAACARPAGTPPTREAGAQTLAAILSGRDVHRGLKSGSAGTPASGVLGGLSGTGGVGRCGPFRFATLVELGGHPRMSSPSMERRKRGPGEWGSGSGRGQASVAVFIRSVVGVFSGPSLGFQVISLLFAQEMLFPP